MTSEYHCTGTATEPCAQPDRTNTFAPSLGRMTRITDDFTGEWLYVLKDDPRCPKECYSLDK